MKEAIVFTIMTMFTTSPMTPDTPDIKTLEDTKEVYVKAFEKPTKEAAANIQVITYIQLPTDWEKVE
jgi:outer membrane receptor for ferrienterochelin and colicin